MKDSYIAWVPFCAVSDSPLGRVVDTLEGTTRLNAAVDLYFRELVNQIMLSGGNHHGEKLIYVYRQYLIDRGVDADDIIIEDESNGLTQNVINSYNILMSLPNPIMKIFMIANKPMMDRIRLTRRALRWPWLTDEVIYLPHPKVSPHRKEKIKWFIALVDPLERNPIIWLLKKLFAVSKL